MNDKLFFCEIFLKWNKHLLKEYSKEIAANIDISVKSK